jgi:hypothetical protein
VPFPAILSFPCSRRKSPLYDEGMSNTCRHLLHDFEAADLLRMPASRLKRLANTGQVPHVRLPDGEFRFDADDLWQWVDQYRRDPHVSGDAPK